MARYPSDYDVFQEKRDNVDDVMALDINDAYYAILAIEGTLGINPQGKTTGAYTVADRLGYQLDTKGRIKSLSIEMDQLKSSSVQARTILQGENFSFRTINIGGSLIAGYYGGASGTPGFSGATIDLNGNITTESSLLVKGNISNLGNTTVNGNITNSGNTFLNDLTMTASNTIKADLNKENFSNLLRNGEMLFPKTSTSDTQSEVNHWVREATSTVGLDTTTTAGVNFPCGVVDFTGSASNIYQLIEYTKPSSSYQLPINFSMWIKCTSQYVYISLDDNTTKIAEHYLTVSEANGTWQLIQFSIPTLTTTSAASVLKLKIGINQPSATPITFYVAKAMLTFGNIIKNFNSKFLTDASYIQEGVQNIVENGHFEKWVSGVPKQWSVVSGTIAQETRAGNVYAGNYGLKLNSASKVKQVLPLNYYKPNVADVTNYFFLSAWIKSSSASASQLVKMRVYTGVSTYVESTISTSGVWTLVPLRFSLTNSGSIDRLEVTFETMTCDAYISLVSCYQGLSLKSWAPHPADLAAYYDA